MSDHRVSIEWARGAHAFTYEEYSRDHQWYFDGVGAPVAASAATQFLGNGELVDPEQAFVASLASCHMLTFLAVAARRRLVVESYRDDAVGVLARNGEDRLALTSVTLRPVIRFADDSEAPDPAALRSLHERAHRECFLANSVLCEIEVDLSTQWATSDGAPALDGADG
ncbi:MAG: OsmC family protein [Pseudomonadota bacterium]